MHLIKHGWLLQKYDKPPITMLVHSSGVNIGTEVGFRLQGILVDMKLPPVHVLEKNLHGMRQYVTITGLDNISFLNSVRVIYALHDLFGKHFKDGAVDKWTSSTYHNKPSVSFSSRYLSPKAHGDAVSINKLVDPLGLFDNCDDQLVHNNSNVVNYYRCTVDTTNEDESGQFIYECVDPAIFCLGHIVELQVVFYLCPSKAKAHWFFSPTICSIGLIDILFGCHL
ncbi:hypothetical protein K439DRAFT_1611491 [Ramaria rubella]|nr:hypothetical protein K439DRAFT_1611491 [Ramaria rubella]